MSEKCFMIGTSWSDQVVAHHFKMLGRELAARGHRVVFLIDGRRTQDEDHAANPAIYTWPSKRPVNRQDFTFLRRVIRQYRPDCLIANFGAVNTMMIVGRTLRVPVRVAWYHTLSDQIDLDSGLQAQQLRYLRLRKRLIFGLATHLVAVSETAAQDVRRVFGVAQSKVFTWPLLLDDPQAESSLSGRPRRPWQITCVGRLAHTKGQDVLIRALPPLIERFPQLQVEFIGDGPERGACEALAQAIGVGTHCCFTGARPHREVLELMATTTVVVAPSRVEALGLVNVESLAVGTPVVASRTGGIAEVIRNGVEGFLVPPEDATALAERIAQLMTDPGLWQVMSDAARRAFMGRRELHTNIGQQVRWYEALAGAAS